MDSTDRKAELLANLANGVTRLSNSESWQAWLTVQRRLHCYSWANAVLIALQRPDATQVAGFHAWLRLGRHVRKGEKGIEFWPRSFPALASPTTKRATRMSLSGHHAPSGSPTSLISRRRMGKSCRP